MESVLSGSRRRCAWGIQGCLPFWEQAHGPFCPWGGGIPQPPLGMSRSDVGQSWACRHRGPKARDGWVLCSLGPPSNPGGRQGRGDTPGLRSAGWYGLRKACVQLSGVLQAGLIHGVVLRSTTIGVFKPQKSANTINQHFNFSLKSRGVYFICI